MREDLYAILAGILTLAGVYMLMSRHLTRLVAGVIALSHGVNLSLLVSGGLQGSEAPIVKSAEEGAPRDLSAMADPLPQALILTAIVITFALVAFGVSVYRRLHEETGVEDVSSEEAT